MTIQTIQTIQTGVGDIVDVTFSVGNSGEAVVKWFYVEGYFKVGLIGWQLRTREFFMPEEPLPGERWRVQVTEVVYSDPGDLRKGFVRILPLEKLSLTAEERAERARETQLVEMQRLRVAELIEAEYRYCPFCQAALDGKHYCQALLEKVRTAGIGTIDGQFMLKRSRLAGEDVAALVAACEYDGKGQVDAVYLWRWASRAYHAPSAESVKTVCCWEEAFQVPIRRRARGLKRAFRLKACARYPDL